jgi:hypothetical protein
MKKTSLFSINHQLTWIFATMDNLNYIPINLSIVGHESFKVWISTLLGTPLLAMNPLKFGFPPCWEHHYWP